MEGRRIPKALFSLVGEVANRAGIHKEASTRGTKTSNLKSSNIPNNAWESRALNRVVWCKTWRALDDLDGHIDQLEERRRAHYANVQAPPPAGDDFISKLFTNDFEVSRLHLELSVT